MKPFQPGVHPLLQHCTDTTTSLALGALSLVVWGAMFPISLFAAVS